MSSPLAHTSLKALALIDKRHDLQRARSRLARGTKLSSASLFWDFAWRGLLPATLLLAVPLKRICWLTIAVDVAKQAVALTLLQAALAPFYAAAARNHRELRCLLMPTNVANRFVGLWKAEPSRQRRSSR